MSYHTINPQIYLNSTTKPQTTLLQVPNTYKYLHRWLLYREFPPSKKVKAHPILCLNTSLSRQLRILVPLTTLKLPSWSATLPPWKTYSSDARRLSRESVGWGTGKKTVVVEGIQFRAGLAKSASSRLRLASIRSRVIVRSGIPPRLILVFWRD